MTSAETVVVGMGNVVHRDDGAGVHALKMLRRDSRVFGEGVALIEGGTLGLEILSYVQDASHILLLDAINMGAAPGTLIRLTGSDLFQVKASWSAHQIGVVDLLAALSLVRRDDQEVTILGVQPFSTDWGTELSAEVHAALPALIDAAVEELYAWEAESALRRMGVCQE